MSINRRDFISGLGAATILTPLAAHAEAPHMRLNYLSSGLDQRTLETQKNTAITSLAKSIPPVKSADYLRLYVPYLEKESQMYIPTERELRIIMGRSEGKLDEIMTPTPVNEFTLFPFADVDEKGKRFQRLYVVQKKTSKSAQFVKAYKISMAENGFGYAPDSGQTPLDEHRVHSMTIGNFGEVVSVLKKHKDDTSLFKHIPHDGKDHWYVHSFGREAGNSIAEVVTDQYLLTGPNTPQSRAIRIHGTNRSGIIGPDNSWISLLDGVALSGACVRMSNVDIRDLSLSGYVKAGTRVMIHATPEARRNLIQKEPPKEWIPPNQKPKLEERKTVQPQEWIPPKR